MSEERVRIFGISRHRIGADGDGVTTLVALHGCPLQCAYCLNPQCKDTVNQYLTATASETVERCMIDNLYFIATGGGLTVGGGEPLLHPQFVHELRKAMPEEWNLNVETSLNVPADHLRWILDDAKMIIIDVKDLNADIYHKYTSCSIQRLMDNLQLIADRGMQHKCILRLPLIHRYNTTSDRNSSRLRLEDMGFEHFDEFDYIEPLTHQPFEP